MKNDTPTTKMRAEIVDIPDAVQRIIDDSEPAIQSAASEIREFDPHLVCTVARGSSDHAATYLKYAIELAASLPVASLGPSVSSIYGAQLKLSRSVCIGISQSGKSPDIVSMIKSTKQGGALTVAVTNELQSPLAEVSGHVLDIQAGLEKSVAATKTFVTSIVSGLFLIAHWTGDDALLAALRELPNQCAKAIECDWSELSGGLKSHDSLYALGRGPSFAIANEVALKFKETCQIHGEAFSSAEVLHGPVSIVGQKYPVLALVTRDQSEDSICGVCDDLVSRGGRVFATSDATQAATPLPFVATNHPLTDPLTLVVSFYAFVEKLARSRGFNPDLPRGLNKVTETV